MICQVHLPMPSFSIPHKNTLGWNGHPGFFAFIQGNAIRGVYSRFSYKPLTFEPIELIVDNSPYVVVAVNNYFFGTVFTGFGRKIKGI